MELNQKVEPDTLRPISAPRRSKLKAARTGLLYAHSGIGAIGPFLSAVVLGGALWKVVSHDRIVVWVLACAALFLGRNCLKYCFHRQRRDEEAVIKWSKWYSLTIIAGGSLWGIAGIWLFPEGSIKYQFLLTIFVAGIAAAGTVIYSPTKDYVSSLLLTLLPLSGRFIYEFDEFHLTIGGAILLFAGALLLTGRRMHTVYSDSLKLRYDKEELVEDLEHEIARRDEIGKQLKTARDDLEHRVDARTSELKDLNRTLEQEIVERKQIEEELRKSEGKYRLLAENATDIVWTLDLKTLKFTYISPSLQKIRGYSAVEFVQLPLDKTMTPDSYALAMTALGEELERDSETGVQPDRIRLLEFREFCKDGSIIDTEVRIRFLRGANGFPAGLLGITRDVTERKRAKVSLRETEKRYRDVVEKANDIIYRADSNGFLVLVNPVGLRITGYSQEELTHNYLDFTHPDDKEAGREAQPGALISAKLIPDTYHEETIPQGGGRRFGLDFNLQLIIENDASGTVAVLEEISQRKLAEAALREGEERYRYLVENIEDLICTHDLQGNLLFVSSGPARMLGFAATDMVGTNLRSYLVPEMQDVFDTYLTTIRRDGRSSGFMLVQAKDGKKRIWEYRNTLHTGTSGEPIVIGVARDVTERRRAEQVERRLATAIDQATEGVMITNTDGTIQYVNPGLERMTGYSRDELIGQTPRILKSGLHDTLFYQQLWSAIKTGSTWTGQLTNRKKDGSLYHEDATISPVKDASGKIVNFVAVKRDITEHLQLANQLLQAQKMEAVGTLAGGIAHDFNNLLTVVIGFSELLLAEKDQNHPEYGDLQKIFHAAKNGAELVQRLLMFSRKSEPKLIPISLNRRIVQVETLLRRSIPRMVNISLDLSPDLPKINADPSQVEQVLMNLALNASDAMPDVGKLTVRTSIATLDEEYCRSNIEATPGEYVLLEVSDTGHGMDGETVEHIFEPFFTTKELGRGTGLGLAMVYGIVKQHNGHISVCSEVGNGTIFRVYFPTIPLADVEPEAPDSSIMPAFGTETVLLVDDEDFVRELGARILTKQRIYRASGGQRQRGARSLQEGTFTDITSDSRLDHA